MKVFELGTDIVTPGFRWIKKAAACTMLWEAGSSMQGVRYRHLCEQEWERNLTETDLELFLYRVL